MPEHDDKIANGESCVYPPTGERVKVLVEYLEGSNVYQAQLPGGKSYPFPAHRSQLRTVRDEANNGDGGNGPDVVTDAAAVHDVPILGTMSIQAPTIQAVVNNVQPLISLIQSLPPGIRIIFELGDGITKEVAK